MWFLQEMHFNDGLRVSSLADSISASIWLAITVGVVLHLLASARTHFSFLTVKRTCIVFKHYRCHTIFSREDLRGPFCTRADFLDQI